MTIKEQALMLDEQNPWPGLAPYDETGRNYFKGRDDDIKELLRLMRLAPLTALYGKSGLGKSSLLRAGLFPRLRQDYYLPVYIRLDGSTRKSKPPMLQVFELLVAELQVQQVDFPEPEANESVWEYLHRRDLELWSADNHLLTPVLVFDQFEEVFSHGRNDQESLMRMCHELADLIENRIPSGIGSGQDRRQETARLDLLGQRYRIILSFREDFLPEIKNWEHDVPSLLKHWRQLKPMTREQAVAAVSESGAAVLAPGAAQAIVDFVGNLDEARNEGVKTIEPVLLSLCCYQLNLRRQQRNARLIDAELLKSVGQNILQEFYTNAIERMPASVARFIETQLILGDSYRASYPVDLAIEKKFINEAHLADLTGNHRLLRIDQQLGSDRIELIHDRLVSVVKSARDRRKARAEARRVWIIAVLVMLVAGFGMGGYTYWQRSVDELELAKDQSGLINFKRTLDAKNLQVLSSILPKSSGIIYIQIQDNDHLAKSKEIQSALIAKGYKVPEIEILSTGPSDTEVRYFNIQTVEQAEQIAALLRSAGAYDAGTKYIPASDHAGHIARRQFEIWFSEDAFSNLERRPFSLRRFL